MSHSYHERQRALQDQFDTRRLADWLAESTRDFILPEQRAFIKRSDMFFLATANPDGWPECSYKGGEPGFVRVLDERAATSVSFTLSIGWPSGDRQHQPRGSSPAGSYLFSSSGSGGPPIR
jgi:predicted pyridoxine 5'-phosphate oxidase superfamily flavin-nucleotide-binding protein